MSQARARTAGGESRHRSHSRQSKKKESGKAPWPEFLAANAFETDYAQLGRDPGKELARARTANGEKRPSEDNLNSVARPGTSTARLNGLNILSIADPVLNAPMQQRQNFFRRVSESRRTSAPKKMVYKLSNAFDNLAPWTDELWTTNNGEYGAMKPVEPTLRTFMLNTAKWYLPDHPHWKRRPVADYKGLKSTYMDLGKKPSSDFFLHNVTQEFLHQPMKNN